MLGPVEEDPVLESMPPPKRFVRKSKRASVSVSQPPASEAVPHVLDECQLSSSASESETSAESDASSLEEGEIREENKQSPERSSLANVLGYFFPDFYRLAEESGLLGNARGPSDPSRKRRREEDASDNNT